MLLILALLVSSVEAEPDPHTLVYYNARMALRERQPTEALKLWFLRNALESHTRSVSTFDLDFHTVTWVALGELGYCPEELPDDDAGAGLWPLALHNWFLKNMRRGEPPEQPPPWDTFKVHQQQRFVSLADVLDRDELKTVRFFNTHCRTMRDLLVGAHLPGSADTKNHDIELRVLRFLLESARLTVSKEVVRGRSNIDGRLLTLHLREIDELARSTRRADRALRREEKAAGAAVMPTPDIAQSASMAELLSPTTTWNTDDWMALEKGDRLYLYSWVRRARTDTHVAATALELSIVDRLIEGRDGLATPGGTASPGRDPKTQQGEELEAWMSFIGANAANRTVLWSGDRGKRLLGLDREHGFRERSAIALHRGVEAVGAGALAEGLRSFAYALHFAHESRRAEDVRRLSLRWLSYVAARFEVTDTLVAMMVELIPKGDLGQVLEDLVWEAAFRADHASFVRLDETYRASGAFRERLEKLRPFAAGDLGQFMSDLRAGMKDSPRGTMRFIRTFLERLETEDGDIRASHRRTLASLRDLLAANGSGAEKEGSLARTADTLEDRCLAMLEGLATFGDTPRDRARALGPESEIFVGHLRLAPSDVLPWPFPEPEVRAPSPFEPISITPIEWRAREELVMGWKLGP